ncbi:hypothetical protein O6H91_06G060500 [Diphasiastrum complanatum]|uniref:Uncharacterized protein n=1 Tax=Diphasiastrum complanatum TaxID=34168 RepID=A0ACC2DE80_DIPCM|nr:hypothetical protein O6H91_06G060500 [Diphasiastrum complanatum]
MDSGRVSGKNFYAVLGVFEGCSTAEIRSAYRKLAMKWHPDKCANGDPEEAEKSKSKFQTIQEAYSVLADESKRFWYDAGLYRSEEDEGASKEAKYEKYDMSDFLDEMQTIMKKVRHESQDNTFEDIKDLFKTFMDGDVYKSESVRTNSVPFSSYDRKDSRQKSEQASMFFEDGDFFQQVFGSPLSESRSMGTSSNVCSGKTSKGQKKFPRKRQRHDNGQSKFL